MKFNVIVAMDRNCGIGYKGALPWPKQSDDLTMFKKLTYGNAIIMGLNTYQSLPTNMPGRQKIVISKSLFSRCAVGPDEHIRHPTDPYCSIVKSFEDALTCAKCNKYQNIFIIGGEKVYTDAFNRPKEEHGTLYLTKIDGEYRADRFLKGYEKWKGTVCEMRFYKFT